MYRMFLTVLAFVFAPLAYAADVAEQIGLFAALIEGLSSNSMLLVGIAAVLELVLRLVPSKKPLSILVVAAAIVKGLAKLFVVLDNLLDKLLPQNAESKDKE
jgi:hypothetical protein